MFVWKRKESEVQLGERAALRTWRQQQQQQAKHSSSTRLTSRAPRRTLRDVDLGRALPLRLEHARALAPLRLGLQRHRVDDARRRRDVLDLVAHALEPPRLGRLVDRAHDGPVERLALLERAVERDAAELGAHRRLRELADGVERAVDAVRRLEGVGHAHVEDAVDRDRDVVLGDRGLVADGWRACREGGLGRGWGGWGLDECVCATAAAASAGHMRSCFCPINTPTSPLPCVSAATTAASACSDSKKREGHSRIGSSLSECTYAMRSTTGMSTCSPEPSTFENLPKRSTTTAVRSGTTTMPRLRGARMGAGPTAPPPPSGPPAKRPPP